MGHAPKIAFNKTVVNYAYKEVNVHEDLFFDFRHYPFLLLLFTIHVDAVTIKIASHHATAIRECVCK